MGRYHCYADYRAVCPYYGGSNGLEIQCDGTCGCSKLILRYKTAKEREIQRSRHCDNLQKYMQCPLYAVHGGDKKGG